ncbi:MAG TPA: 2'-5' RNA ligase family protein [Bryobacteraceae bacterium]|jgi:2'-5' RNA ligase|nr:2'-5' RNA ligase family protein [Bryobacteraceae bacterium]
MTHIPATPWGQFALVSYLPDPLAGFIHRLRGSLPGIGNPQAHITILPPRPLRRPVRVAADQVRNALRNFPPFAVQLTRVSRFPETNFLYLEIGEGNGALHSMHDALNEGDLACEETFEFRPHLTLGGPVPEDCLDEARGRAEDLWRSAVYPPRFTLEDVVFLWLPPNSTQHDWERLWTHRLTACSNGAALAEPRP